MLKLPNGPITLSRDELRDVLFSVKGARVVTITARTKPDMVGGKKCPLAGLEKVSLVNGIINFSYENAVDAQRYRETDDVELVEKFTPEPRRWGSRLYAADTVQSGKHRMLPLVDKLRHDQPYFSFEDIKQTPSDRLYLELKVQKSLGHVYYLDDVEVSHSDAEEHIRKPSPSATQQVEREVILRDYALVNIQQLTLDGNTFVVAEEMTLPQLAERTNQRNKGAIAV